MPFLEHNIRWNNQRLNYALLFIELIKVYILSVNRNALCKRLLDDLYTTSFPKQFSYLYICKIEYPIFWNANYSSVIWDALLDLVHVHNLKNGVIVLVKLQVEACNFTEKHSFMGVFHGFLIVQMLPNDAKHQIYFSLTANFD